MLFFFKLPKWFQWAASLQNPWLRGWGNRGRKWQCSDGNHEKNQCETDSSSARGVWCFASAPSLISGPHLQAVQKKQGQGDVNIKDMKVASNLQIVSKPGLYDSSLGTSKGTWYVRAEVKYMYWCECLNVRLSERTDFLNLACCQNNKGILWLSKESLDLYAWLQLISFLHAFSFPVSKLWEII